MRTEGWQYVNAEVRLVAGKRLWFEVGLGSHPSLGPLDHARSREVGVRPFTSKLVALDSDGEAVRIDLLAETLGSFSP
jgi:hypothetical protein